MKKIFKLTAVIICATPLFSTDVKSQSCSVIKQDLNVVIQGLNEQQKLNKRAISSRNRYQNAFNRAQNENRSTSRKRKLVVESRNRIASYLHDLTKLGLSNIVLSRHFDGLRQHGSAALARCGGDMNLVREQHSEVRKMQRIINAHAAQMRNADRLLAEVIGIADRPSRQSRKCSLDCHRRCKIKLGFVKFVEPGCHVKCEAEKNLCKATGVKLPNLPLSPVEVAKATGRQVCGGLFQVITKAVIANCSNRSGRNDGMQIVEAAKNRIIETGLIRSHEFSGVKIRWCPLPRNTKGMVPDRNLIYLNSALRNGSIREVARHLAHEMYHVRQYGSLGTDNFKCIYSRKFAACGGCQDRRHSLEREAYEFEDRVRNALR